MHEKMLIHLDLLIIIIFELLLELRIWFYGFPFKIFDNFIIFAHYVLCCKCALSSESRPEIFSSGAIKVFK